ncbi:hypothetical protein LEP1GSC036_3099 [Leptospira weilii str. 2006001853]|uniref:Uncharacterized protein n=2 Tax=Leptospira weilii TaxID=28184 RepID=A0A828Z021_9LEPT|nr:hypothetical protein LEP1GSC036_3099 [Leptospira weilii str. 2006001853]
MFLRISRFWIVFLFLNVCCSEMRSKDLISVENSVFFFKDELNSNEDSIRFEIKVTNQSKNPIPDLGVDNRSEFVNFYFNGKVENPLILYNGLEAIDGEKTIPPGLMQDFAWSQPLRFFSKGNEFTVQWEYRKIKSKILKVNVKNRSVETLK